MIFCTKNKNSNEINKKLQQNLIRFGGILEKINCIFEKKLTSREIQLAVILLDSIFTLDPKIPQIYFDVYGKEQFENLCDID